MKKISKILFILLAICLLTINACYAIDLNLTDSLDDVSTNTNDANSSYDYTNSVVDDDDNTVYSGNSNSYDNTTYSNESTDSLDYTTNTINNNPTSTTVSQLSSSQELTISDIINIFIIVIGIILIFLGVAILVKSKNQ